MYAATFDTHQLVGCTVLGAPWSRDRRGNVGADVECDRRHPRRPRRTHHRVLPNVCNPAGTARAPFYTGAVTLPVIPRREGVEALPYDGWRGIRSLPASHQPISHGAKRRDSSPFRGAEGAGAVRRRRPLSHAGRAWKPAPTMCRREWRSTITSSDRAAKRAKRTGPRTGPFCAEVPADSLGFFTGRLPSSGRGSRRRRAAWGRSR